jgi:hypothetical protein
MFEDFKNRMARQGSYMGKALKNQSDMIMDATFKRDPAYRVCYLQNKGTIFPEQTFEGYKKAKAVFAGEDGYDVSELTDFEPIECKYLVKSYYSIQGDAVDYYLQFRPNAHGSNPNIRVGSFVFVPDDLGAYNLWMIVARDDRPQFPQFYILRCNLLLKWHIGHNEIVHYEGSHIDAGSYISWAVQRTQSSYNSGVWSDYHFTTPENQKIAILPTNMDTNTITYNEHFVIDYNPLRRLAWEVTKLDNSAIHGITRITFAQQSEYDPVDNFSWINLTSENYSNTETGINYDFYCPRFNDVEQHTLVPEVEEPIVYSNKEEYQNKITYSGVKPSVKIGGSYKTFTADLNIIGLPYWSIDYISDGKTVCTMDLKYVGDTLACDNRLGDFEIADTNKISYSQNGEKVFGIQFKHNPEKPLELKIKCQSILNMIGGKLVIKAGDSQFAISASLEVEVESL